MKLISLFLLLFLLISINSENQLDTFSIDNFIKDLKNDGLFEIIESIKEVYGQDIAIISCEELNENHKGNCKRLVIEYMRPRASTRYVDEEEAKCIKILNFSKIIKNEVNYSFSNNFFNNINNIRKFIRCFYYWPFF
jgi:hypothetical protein